MYALSKNNNPVRKLRAVDFNKNGKPSYYITIPKGFIEWFEKGGWNPNKYLSVRVIVGKNRREYDRLMSITASRSGSKSYSICIPKPIDKELGLEGGQRFELDVVDSKKAKRGFVFRLKLYTED